MADPFWKLCWKMDLDGVRLALQSEHIDVNSRDRDGRTGLMWAFIRSRFNQLKCNPVAMLILNHPSIDVSLRSNSGNTALFFAAKNRENYKHILVDDNDVDPNIKNSDGDSAVMLAVKTRDMVLIKLLLADPRVDLDTRDDCKRSKEKIAR